MDFFCLTRKPPNMAGIYGGVPKGPQRRQARTADALVATPGRLKDLVADGSISLNSKSNHGSTVYTALPPSFGLGIVRHKKMICYIHRF